MATLGSKKRENLHTDIGMVGRKTGFIAKNNLQRDDDGMESVSAFFSSPGASSVSQPPFDLSDNEADSSHEDEDEDATSTWNGNHTPAGLFKTTNKTPSSTHNGSISMEVEESSGRSLATTLQSRRIGLTPISHLNPGISSPAKRLSMTGTPRAITPRQFTAPLSMSPRRRPQSQRSSQSAGYIPNSIADEHSPKLRSELDLDRDDDLVSSKENLPRLRDAKTINQVKEPVRNPGRGKSKLSAPGLRTAERGNRLVTQNRSQQRSTPPQVARPTGRNDYEDGSENAGTEPESEEDDSDADVDVVPITNEKSKSQGLPIDGDVEQPQSDKPLQSTSNELGDQLESDPKAKKRGRKTQKMTKEPKQPSKAGQTVENNGSVYQGLTQGEIVTSSPVRRLGESVRNSNPRSRKNRDPHITGGNPTITPVDKEHNSGSKRIDAPARVRNAPNTKTTGASKKGNTPTRQDTPDLDVETSGEALSTQQNLATKKRGRKRKVPELNPDNGSFEVPDTNSRDEMVDSKKRRKRDAPVSTVAESQETNSRSQRSRIAPLQFWKNEKRIYTVNERRKSGTAVSLTESVIRIEDDPAPKTKNKSRPKIRRATAPLAESISKKRKPKSKQDEDLGEDHESSYEEEDWEGVGKLVGMVKQWSTEDNGIEDEEIEDEIATSRRGIEFKPIFGSDYMFAKTLGNEFMGCGILELRTGATKKLKSSGKMQLVFFILEGKVEAEVNELGFRIGKGGQFQVPRGNMYKISNPFKATSKIFFAQACIPETDTD